MTSNGNESEGSPPSSRFARPITGLLNNWGRSIQVLTAVIVVVLGGAAYFIDNEIAEQERERAASERALALSNYFVNSKSVLKLKDVATDIYKNYSDNRNSGEAEFPLREMFAKAVKMATYGSTTEDGAKGTPPPSSSQGSGKTVVSGRSPSGSDDEDNNRVILGEHMHMDFGRLFSEIKRISNCGRYEDLYFDMGLVREGIVDGNPPLCDRTTLQNLVMDELSELFFAYRFVFYCDRFISTFYEDDVKLFEKMMGSFLLDDYSRHPNPDSEKFFVFLEDRDRERAVDRGVLSQRTHNFYILRLSHDADYCDAFRPDE